MLLIKPTIAMEMWSADGWENSCMNEMRNCQFVTQRSKLAARADRDRYRQLLAEGMSAMKQFLANLNMAQSGLIIAWFAG